MNVCNLDLSKCTGCGSCLNSCPQNAISFVKNGKGFYYPNINFDLCIDCGLCGKNCLINKKNDSIIETKVYGAWSLDKKIRKTSTSGGIFYSIAKTFIDNGNIVYGSILKDDKVLISRATNMEELRKMQGSKYVQGETKYIFQQVKNDLISGQMVLFSGTPCQVKGLKLYLMKEYDNLFTIDIVCHGVPSPLVFESYYNMINEKYKNHGKIIDIQFRYKKPNWTKFSMKIEFNDGFTYLSDMYHDYYLRSFLENYITRPSCHDCNFTNLSRPSDITLGDFWSFISDDYKNRNDNKGINLILVNSTKGDKLIQSINSEIQIFQKSLLDAKRSNKCLYSSYKPNINEDLFWSKFLKEDDCYLFFKSFFSKKKKISFKNKVFTLYRNYAFLFPGFIKKKINGLFDRRIGK